MDLMIPLTSQGRTPMYEQIYEYIKKEIRQGNLRAKAKLPSTRTLAAHLSISRSTAQMAYEQLLSEGYIESEPCRGYFVAAIDDLVEVKETPSYPFVGQEPKKSEGIVVDFSPRGIDLDSFPFNIWRKISKNILVTDNKALFLNGDHQGEYALREAIRSYLHSARGVRCSADQIIVGAGNEYLLMLLSLILGRGKGIAMENLTYQQAYRVFVSQGHLVVPIDIDKSGMSVDDLRKKRRAEVIYIMPANQHPMGIVMPIRRRQELLAWADEENGRFIIEDDYDSEFRYKGKPIPALQGMDRKGKVIYIGTFSQSIAPAIRVGFLVLPESLLEYYRQHCGFFSSTVSRIDQNILYQFLTEGHYERHLNRMRAIYKAKHDCLLGELKDFEQNFAVGGEHAGLHVLLQHKREISEQKLIEQALRAGVKVYGLSRYVISPKQPSSSSIVLGYANLSEKEIRQGMNILRRVWQIGDNHL